MKTTDQKIDTLDAATDLVVRHAKFYAEARRGYEYAVRWNGTTYMAGDTHELVNKVRDAMDKENAK